MVLLPMLVFDVGNGLLVNLDAHPLKNIPELGHYAEMCERWQKKRTHAGAR